MGKIVNCVRGKPTFQIYIYNQSILLIELDTKTLASQDIFQKKIYSERKCPSGTYYINTVKKWLNLRVFLVFSLICTSLQSNKVINFITLPVKKQTKYSLWNIVILVLSTTRLKSLIPKQFHFRALTFSGAHAHAHLGKAFQLRLYGSRSMLSIEHAYSGPELERTGWPSHEHIFMYVWPWPYVLSM